MALASTLPTGSLADCGANWSTACASVAGRPRIRSTTRRAFRGVTRTYRAFALASINPPVRTQPRPSRGEAPRRGVPGSCPPGLCPRGGVWGGRPPGLAEPCVVVLLSAAAPVVLDVTAESPRGRELAKLVAHHRLGDEHRDVLTAVVDGDRVAEHGRHDHGTPGPRPDDGLRSPIVLHVHLLHQVVVHEGALLKTTRHRVLLL